MQLLRRSQSCALPQQAVCSNIITSTCRSARQRRAAADAAAETDGGDDDGPSTSAPATPGRRRGGRRASGRGSGVFGVDVDEMLDDYAELNIGRGRGRGRGRRGGKRQSKKARRKQRARLVRPACALQLVKTVMICCCCCGLCITIYVAIAPPLHSTCTVVVGNR